MGGTAGRMQGFLEEPRRKPILGDPDRALLTKPLLPVGCQLCFPGLKAVIFVTGLCDESCYYCPVSREKLGRDVFYVNEERVTSIEEAVLEVARSGARGASITGGDPLTRPHRVATLIRALKDNFGSRFHVHLYTSGRYATWGVLKELKKAGLDEIRFHPVRDTFLDAIERSVGIGLYTGIEIPIGPGLKAWAKRVLREAELRGAAFANLNELEFVQPNARHLLARGIRESKTRPFTAEGSLEAAIEVLEWAQENLTMPVHFCPARFKDAIQTRNRLRRLSYLDARWFEQPTSRGTLQAIHVDNSGCRMLEYFPTRSRRPVVSEEECDGPGGGKRI